MTEVVSSILGPLVEKFSSAVEEIQLVCGVKDDQEKLINKLKMIQMVLADAEQRQTKENDVHLWLSRLKNWCYDAEDVLDEFESKALWRRVQSTKHLTLKRKVRYLYSWISEMIFQFKMLHNMKELRKSLDGIDKDKTQFTLLTNVHERTIVPWRETHSFVPASNVIGRNEEKESIIEWLRRSDDAEARIIEVLPIIGIGGVGKTTLTKLVYSDERVKEHFKNNQVWLSMPLEFKIANIIRDIIKSLSGETKFDNCNLDMMQNYLRNLVENRRCLFVMDDVWTMSRNDWLELIDLLGGLSKGSKVIVTTQNERITEIMGIVSSINLASLSPKDSLTLFVKCAFNQGQEKNHPDLMEIGKEIVSKCEGNPMVVKTLGSLLYSKNNRSDWEYVRDSEMKELRKRFNVIDEKKTRFNLWIGLHEKTIVPQKETHSFVTASNVIGRNKEKENIIELLRRSNDAGARIIEVVPIIGMGGTGKTTLAKMVYNDERIKKHFKNNQVWLSMPLEFEIEKILRVIIESLSGEAKFDNCNLDVLQNKIRNLVENQRYLFVMDGVWAMRMDDWVELTDLLRGLSKGSKVIVTTRNEDIAEIMGTVSPIILASLSPKDSLTLFMKYAFDQGQEKNHLDLVKISKEIVSKCEGNPMAVKALGILLYSKNNLSDWEYVRDSEMWQLQTPFLPSLRISYDLMPSHLKQCFAYCSIFPKNQEFSNFDLIQLWISSGFIQGRNIQEMEEIGQRYLEELLSISFLKIVNDLYPFLTFQMDDLIYELAISVAQTELSNIKVWTQDISPTTRHLSFPNHHGVSKDELSGCLSKLSHVRTIVCKELGSCDSEEFFLETCISRSKHLRVLWLEGSSFDLLPSSIGGLKHLRFLSLQNNWEIKKLPKSVCKLRNLRTLNLRGCDELEELPTNIKNMISLHVLIITTKQERFPEGGIGCLTSLRCLFISECENLEALFDDIQSLTSLRQLLIYNCSKLASLPQGIKNLTALEHLMIYNCESLRLPEGDSNEPCSISRLQTLTLAGLPKLVSLPGWLEGSASTLQSIRFKDCTNLSVLPEWLQNCSSLITMEINKCPELSSPPGGTSRIPTLTPLRIINCRKWEHS